MMFLFPLSVMDAMRTNSPDVPTLLTNYILKGMFIIVQFDPKVRSGFSGGAHLRKVF